MSLSQSFGWSTDTFFDKLEAFCLKHVSIFDNQPDMDQEESQWNILTDVKISEFIAQMKRQMEDHPKTVTPTKHSKLPQPSVQSTQSSRISNDIATEKLSIKGSLTYNSHLSEAQKGIVSQDPLCISIPFELDTSTKKLISCSPRDGSISINDHMESLVSPLGLEWSHPGVFHAESITTFGRLCSDVVDNVKWNEKSILLETSRSLASGHRVKCHLGSNLSSFSFFPGQVIAAEGKVASEGIILDRLIPLPLLEKAVSPLSELIDSNQRSIHILVGCGPYGSINSLDTCLSQVTEHTNVMILLGPFIDEDMEKTLISSSEEIIDNIFQKYFLTRFKELLLKFHQLTLILVPSTKDTFHYDISLPQEPFGRIMDDISHDRLILMPNPAIFAVKEIVIALTSVDILFDLSAYEISRQGFSSDSVNGSGNDGIGTMDRLSRLCKHLLNQRHFYPLYPSNTNTPMKNGFCLNGMSIPIAPDILILPSQHRHFVKSVDDVLCINPGRVHRSLDGGTMAKMVIHPMKLSEFREYEKFSASKEPDSVFIPHLVESRCRVDILSINAT